MMSEPAETPSAKKADSKSGIARRSRFARGVIWSLNAVLALGIVLLFLVGGGVLFLKDNPLIAPNWVQHRVETRLAEVSPDRDIRFGEMAFILDDNWRPRLRLREVRIDTPTGAELAHFNEVQIDLAGGPLLDGHLRPRAISLSGIVASLRRDKDGSVALRAGRNSASAQRRAATIPELIGQIDEVFLRPDLAELASIDLQALTFRYEDVASGRAWTVDGGRLFLDRNGDDLTLSADFAVLGGGTGVATVSANYSSRIGRTEARFGASFEDVAAQDVAAQGPAFAWLGVLRAPISGAVRSGLTEEGKFEPVAATLQIGAGVVQPNPQTSPIDFDGARSYFSYDPVQKLLRFDDLSVQSEWITAQATGEAALSIHPETGQLNDLVGQIQLAGISANPNGLYPEAVRFDGAEADLRLTLNPFEVTLGRLQVEDQAQILRADGRITASDLGWRVALDAHLNSAAPEEVLSLWPKSIDPKNRKWVRENVKAGKLSNVQFSLRRKPGTAPVSHLSFDFDQATVRYSKTLPFVTQGQGQFSLAQNRLVVILDQGQIEPPQGGAIQLRDSSFVIPDVKDKREKGTPAQVHLQSQSDVLATLSLLNMPPIAAMDKAKLPVELAEGNAALTAQLGMMLKPGTRPKVQFEAKGQLTDVRSDVLVKGRRMTSDRLDLAADNTALTLQGQGEIDGVPFDTEFLQPIGKGAGAARLTGEIGLTQDTLDTFGVTLPEGSVSGAGQARIAIDLPRGAPPQMLLQSDLTGIAVEVPQVSWRKGRSQAGELVVAGQLGDKPQIERIELAGPGLSAKGSVRFNADRSLDRVRFDQLQVGNWLNTPVDLIGRGAGKPLQVALRGGSLDLRRAEFGDSTGNTAAPPMEVALNRLQITDTIALTDMTGRFATGGGLDGTFEAKLNGAVPVAGRVVPQNGRSAVRLTSADAGSVLRASGLLQRVVGGDMNLVLLPVGSGGAFDGRLTIKGVTIRDAPGIAALLNAVSVVGLINELNGDGIYFDDVEASFRLTPNQLTLTEGSAVGASMGLSMDGTYRLDTGQLGMQGVISPVYLLNGIGSLLTRKGEGLIGFNYTLKGSAKTPSVGVNPLSALTPAMFREIFRAPPPALPVVEGVSESTLPESRPPQKTPVADDYEGR